MAHHDIVVIGGSAGSIAALTTLVRDLPPDLPEAIFVVVHFPPYAVSRLAEILSRAGPLPAVNAANGMPVRRGEITVAPPDRHLLLRPGWVELSHGPRENHSRPAIDPLFRSAARAYGSRVVGVVLSGALYDGSLGLMAIKLRGGIAIVQDPREAAVDSMPRHALTSAPADFVLGAAAIAAVIRDLSSTTVQETREPFMTDDERVESVIAVDFAEQAHDERIEETTVYTCPDCGGVMWQDGHGQTLRFRCHTGHAYTPEILLSQKSEEFEAALWASLRLLKEKATLTRQMAARTPVGGNGEQTGRAARIAEQAELDEQYVRRIQEILEAMPNPADQLSRTGEHQDDLATAPEGPSSRVRGDR